MNLKLIRESLDSGYYPKELIEPFIYWKIINVAVNKGLPFKGPKTYSGTQQQIIAKRAKVLKEHYQKIDDAIFESMRAIVPDLPIEKLDYFQATDKTLNEFMDRLVEDMLKVDSRELIPFMELLMKNLTPFPNGDSK